MQPKENQEDYINQLIEEAGRLHKEFLTGAHYSWYRYSPNHLGYRLWKQRVLEIILTLGEKNPYYTDLLTIERECSRSRPVVVFDAYLETLKKTCHLLKKGFFFQAAGPAATCAAAYCPERQPEDPVAAADTQKDAGTKAVPVPDAEASKAVTALAPAETSAPPPPAVRTEGKSLKQKAAPAPVLSAKLDSEAREAYGALIALARQLIDRTGRPDAGTYKEIAAVCALTLETLKTNPALLACSAFCTADNYLYAHTANVAILTQAIGLDSGLSGEESALLSFCALTHDLGMCGFQELYSRKERFSDSEFSSVTLHPDSGAASLERITDVPSGVAERAKRVILQTHERIDTSGYPYGLTHKEIDPLAQIIGAADVYEAMTHPRAWREACHPCETLRGFIETGEKRFSATILKSLIRSLSMYPPSSLVALSTGEIARVVAARNTFRQPVVEVLLAPDFTPLSPYLLDLSEHLVRYSINRPVSRNEMQDRNPGFAAKLDSARWWEFSAGTAGETRGRSLG